MIELKKIITAIKKGTLFIIVLLLILFAVSIQISLELFNQKSLTFAEKIRSEVIDTVSSKFRKLEDRYIASFNNTSDFSQLTYFVDEIEWLDSLEIFAVSKENGDSLSVWKNDPKTSVNDTFLMLTLPALQIASKNLKNRFIYGAALEEGNGNFSLPFSITLADAYGIDYNSFGTINLSKLFSEEINVENNKLLISATEIKKDFLEQNKKFKVLEKFEGRLDQPNIDFFIYTIRIETKEISYLIPAWVFSSDTLLILSANLLLWISLIFYWLEHLKRVDREKQIEEIAERAQKQANLASIGEIATAISHEVNQPISAIEIYAKICQDMIAEKGFSKNDLEKNLEEIRRQTNRCGTIMKSMLSTRKLTVSQNSYVFLEELKKNVEAVIELKASKNKTKVFWNIDPKQKVFTNLVAIEQIITNFAYNGIEAMYDSKTEVRELSISSKLENVNSKYKILKLIVADKGPGIGDSEKLQIFEPFFTTKEYGNGLGLSLCKSLCEQCSATINISRNQFNGMNFEVLIPTRKSLARKDEFEIYDTNRLMSVKDVV